MHRIMGQPLNSLQPDCYFTLAATATAAKPAEVSKPWQESPKLNLKQSPKPYAKPRCRNGLHTHLRRDPTTHLKTHPTNTNVSEYLTAAKRRSAIGARGLVVGWIARVGRHRSHQGGLAGEQQINKQINKQRITEAVRKHQKRPVVNDLVRPSTPL